MVVYFMIVLIMLIWHCRYWYFFYITGNNLWSSTLTKTNTQCIWKRREYLRAKTAYKKDCQTLAVDKITDRLWLNHPSPLFTRNIQNWVQMTLRPTPLIKQQTRTTPALLFLPYLTYPVTNLVLVSLWGSNHREIIAAFNSWAMPIGPGC